MTGPEHYAEAERLVRVADEVAAGDADVPGWGGIESAAHVLAAAQVHATLALAAATADPAVQRYTGGEGSGDRAWAKATA